MQLPRWVVFLVAAWVILFGAYRIYIGFRRPKDGEAKKGGMWGLPKRTHFLVGVIYLILGTFLILSAFGWRPFKL